MRRNVVVTVDSHPLDDAIVIKTNNETQQTIILKDLSKDVDIRELASTVIAKCPLLSESSRTELEQVLYYLRKRKGTSEREGSASSTATTSTVTASIDEVESYLELFYEGIEEKKKAAQMFCELARSGAYLQQLAENEAAIGALARVYREDWKKNFELATAISSVFVELSRFQQFHGILTHHKIGALCLSTVEYELKRGETWMAETKIGDEKNARRCRVALKKQQSLLAGCVEILTNLANDLSIEVKVVRKDVVSLLTKCAEIATATELRLAVVRMLLKLSIFQENLTVLENGNTADTILSWFPLDEPTLSKTCVRFLFNLAFSSKLRTKLVKGGLVSHIAPLVKSKSTLSPRHPDTDDTAALHLLYQLSIDDEGKTMIKFTDSIQLLMRDLLSGDGSDVTKAVLLNVCVEKRNAQLVCGTEGGGLDLLMEMSLEHRDLLVAKILRTIAGHEGPTQDMFLKWMPKLIGLGKTESIDTADDKAAIGLEWIATAALIKSADWAKLISANDIVSWMQKQLLNHSKESTPLQLQIVIMCGTMAKNLDCARLLVPLVDSFLNLLHNLQTDDEYVLQLLYFLLQLLRHRELSDELMGPESAVGSYFVDLMHDRNAAIREMCDNALLIIGENSQDWARKIAAARFRWHNEQWLSMIEAGQEIDETAQPEDDFGLIFNDQFEDFSDSTGFDTP